MSSSPEEAIVGGERLPAIITARCLGEQCVNWRGAACSAYEELMTADGQSEGTDFPPLREKASYALYGLVCMGGDGEKFVAGRAEIFKPGVGIMKIVALSGTYGDMPLVIQAPEKNLSVKWVS